MMKSLSLAPLGVLLLLPGCFDNFDPNLYMDARAAVDAGPSLRFGDFCSDLAVSDIPTGVNIFPVDTTGTSDSMRDLASCVGTMTPGNDAFVAVQAAPNERWHFHVRQSGGSRVDPVLYLLDGCNERNCNDDRAINACGPGGNEHLSIVAPPSGGLYYLGIDSVDPGGFVGTLEVYRPLCGNHPGAEHSENCDDGNLMDGDGCDSLCRIELTGSTPEEAAVNDDFYSANHVLSVDGTTIFGETGGGCDVDVFAVDLVAGTTLTASLNGRGGGCPALAPEVRLSVLAPSGTLELLVAPLEACPALMYVVPSTGTYFLRVTVPDTRASTFAYDLSLAVP